MVKKQKLSKTQLRNNRLRKKDLKKNTRRSSKKYPYLNRNENLLIRQSYMDMDYIDKLNDKEKAFMNQFLKEELNANIGSKEKPTGKFNKTQKDRKRVFRNNNARNRCLYGRKSITTELDHIGDNPIPLYDDSPTQDYENRLIDAIDKRREDDLYQEQLASLDEPLD